MEKTGMMKFELHQFTQHQKIALTYLCLKLFLMNRTALEKISKHIFVLQPKTGRL
jgi:hypothetical protein